MHWGIGDGHMGFGWMGLWWLVGAAFVAALLWALLRRGRRPASGRPESAEEILKRRYASGELDRDTFEHMLSDLRNPHGGTP